MKFIRSKDWWLKRIANEPDVPIGAGGAYCARQSFSSRVWSALGFGMSNRTDMIDWRCDEELGFAPGALVTDTVIHLNWLDRLRVLVSGKLRVEVSTKTDVLVQRSKSIAAIGVMPIGYSVPGTGHSKS